MTKLWLCIFLAGVIQTIILAQDDSISGRITDKRTGKPLAFVNIVYKESGQGTVSDIDGEFSIPVSSGIDFLKFSYLGYELRMIQQKDIMPGTRLEVNLEETAYEIAEVEVQPGINPAHRIIMLASRNRKLNNPEMMQSFSYTSYSKMFFTLEQDSLWQDSTNEDTIQYQESATADTSRADLEDDLERMEDFLGKQHLFLMEFVSEREFLHPDRNKETVTASRVSGFSDPSFTLLASQLQSTDFYDDLIMISDKKYLNPLSRGSTRKYLFILEDTLFTELQDTLFVISYLPLKNRNFDGLQGILHINSRGYAIQNVIAEAAETSGMFHVKIQQQYEFIDNRQWFPVQLNTDLILSPAIIQAEDIPVTLVGVGKSYLSDIILDPQLKPRDFNHVEIVIDDDAHKQDSEYWTRYRVVPLSRKDTNTYVFIDSIGEEANLDRNLKIFETLASGYIPAGFLNLDYRSLIHWNRYEGLRLGIAAETNQKFSPWFSLGGKFAYGTRDGQIKYGGHFRVNLNRRQDAFIKFNYNHDVVESAGVEFLDKPPITSSAFFRSYMIAGMDMVDEKEVSLQFPLIRYMKIRGYLSRADRTINSNYRYTLERNNEILELDHFKLLTTGFKLRYAHKEKFMETPRGTRISLGTNYPILQANVSFGLPLMGGEFEYTRMEAMLSKKIISKSFGETKIMIKGGLVDRDVPYPLLYAGQGSYGRFTMESENSFATMRANEFIADRFTSIHFQQDFGKLLFRKKKFQPGISLASSVGYGEFRFPLNHIDIPGHSYERGYFESGILFNNLIRQAFIGYGLGVFYRYGPYSLPKTIDNFAFKFTVRFNL
jgi:hypothetical protein